MADDVEAFDMGDAPASPDALARLRKAIQQSIDQQELVEQLESDLEAAQKELSRINMVEIPDLMAEIQSDHFSYSGWDVRVEDFVRGSLPKEPDKRQLAIDTLVGYGAEGLIKTEVTTSFGRSEYDTAKSLAERLEGEGFPVSLGSSVHASTLAAFVRSRIRNGEPVEAEKLGIYVAKIATFKPVKKKK